jgi:hypothetical protein
VHLSSLWTEGYRIWLCHSDFCLVMAGHSRSKNGVASARLCPAIHVFSRGKEDVDARHKAGHDEFVERSTIWRTPNPQD